MTMSEEAIRKKSFHSTHGSTCMKRALSHLFCPSQGALSSVISRAAASVNELGGSKALDTSSFAKKPARCEQASERRRKKTNSRVATSAACQEATSRKKKAQENQIVNKEKLSNEEARHKRKSIEHVSRQSSSRHSRGQMQVNPPHSASAWPRSAHHHWIQRSHHGHAH